MGDESKMIGAPWHRSLTRGFVGKAPVWGIATKDGLNVAWVSGHPIDADAVMGAILTAVNAHSDLVSALKEVTEMYCDLANSGDCGSWDPESVDEIKHARAALAKADPTA